MSGSQNCLEVMWGAPAIIHVLFMIPKPMRKRLLDKIQPIETT